MIFHLRYFFSADKKLFESLRNILGFAPRNIYIYRQCLRHRSLSQTTPQQTDYNNERLEFLGDAILGAVVAHYLFSRFPFKDEGFLTKIRSRIVSRQNLNLLSSKLGIDRLILSRKENQHGFGSMNGDALEAFIGAIYIDKGYKKAEEFIITKLINLHLDIDEILHTDKDYKSKIMEWSQKEKKKVTYLVRQETAHQHKRHYKISLLVDHHEEVTGEGSSKKAAEQHAAELFCIKLGI